MQQVKSIEKSLLWDITRQCNLNCIHCYNSGGSFDINELDVAANYTEIIERLLKAKINHIHLLGGEPLMVKGLPVLLRYAHNRNMLVSINTNGTLLTNEVVKMLVELGVFQLTISLDGATELTNDAIRGTGTYRQVIKRLENLMQYIQEKQSPILVQVATVITKQNYSTIHKLPRVLRDVGVKYLDVLKLYECGNATDNESLLNITNEEYLNILGKLLVECYRNHIFAQFDCKPKVMELLNSRYGFQSNQIISEIVGCCAGKKILFMDSTGNIFPCSPFSHEVHNTELTANIFDENYIDKLTMIEKSISHRIKTFSSKRKAVCSNCSFLEGCTGCAICYKNHEDLCETAVRLFSA